MYFIEQKKLLFLGFALEIVITERRETSKRERERLDVRENEREMREMSEMRELRVL